MLKFGKKVTSLPLLISSLTACSIGFLFGLNISADLGWEIGIVIFMIMFGGHYLLVLPIICNYWDSTDDKICYSDLKKIHKRILPLLFPKTLPLKYIDKSDIHNITVLGLPQKDANLASRLVVPEEGGLIYNWILMINEPVIIRIKTYTGQVIDLDVSRDYVKYPAETLGKLRIFLLEFNPMIIHLSDATRKIIKIN